MAEKIIINHAEENEEEKIYEENKKRWTNSRKFHKRRFKKPFEVEVALVEGATTLQMPEKKTSGSAGYDLKAFGDFVVPAGKSTLVPTGVKMKIPYGNLGFITPRSSMGMKLVTIPNSPGTIDSDYRDEIKVILFNQGNEDYTIKTGDRIAQIIFMPIRIGNVSLVPELSPDVSNDRTGGFGSTGVN